MAWVDGRQLMSFQPGGYSNARNSTSRKLLQDPGFEFQGVWETVVDAREEEATFFSVAPAWDGWYTESPRTEDWMNRIPNGYPHSENGARFTHSGTRSQELNRGSATFTAAVYQTVAVPEGSNVIGSAFVRMNLDLNSGITAQARVGIDPNGGTSPFESDIVWSAWAVNVLDINFRQLTVNATATGTQVTLWLYATQNVPSDPNGVYWDTASVTIGGAGGAVEDLDDEGNPVPTAVPPPAVAPFVTAQGARDDGSIVHIVVTGDTLAAISVAYGVSMDEILELNGLSDGRFLSVGQELLIRPATDDTDDEGDDDGGGETDTVDDETDDTTDTTDDSDDTTDDDDETDSGDTTGDDDDTTDDGDEDDDTSPDTDTIDETDDTTDEQPVVDDDDEDDPEPTQVAVVSTATPAPTAPVAVAEEAEIDPADTLGSVCLSLFEDIDVDRQQDADEVFLADASIDLTQDGATLETYATDGVSEPFCIDGLEPGSYVAVASAPDGYGLTTAEQFRLTIFPGGSVNVNFGATQDLELIAPPPEEQVADLDEVLVPDEESDSTEQLLQISGLIVFGLAGLTLIAGLGMSLFLRRR